jgi:ATP-dependent Clp protease ATP-binding subunit ClpA
VFERFTDPARRAVVLAQEEARDLDHHYLGTEHLLLGVLREGSGTAARALQRLGIEVADVRSDLVRIVGRGSPAERWEEDADALRTIGIDLEEVRRRVEETFGPRALERRAPRSGRRRTRDCASAPFGALAAGRIPLTPRAKKVLALALREATALRHGSIGPEHLLLGILREGEGLAMQILTARGASPVRLRAALAADLSGPGDVPGRPA